MTEVETSIALVRAAASKNDALLKAQSRVWASDVRLATATRLLKLFSATGVEMKDPHLCGAIAAQRGRMADMDFIAAAIAGVRRA